MEDGFILGDIPHPETLHEFVTLKEEVHAAAHHTHPFIPLLPHEVWQTLTVTAPHAESLFMRILGTITGSF